VTIILFPDEARTERDQATRTSAMRIPRFLHISEMKEAAARKHEYQASDKLGQKPAKIKEDLEL